MSNIIIADGKGYCDMDYLARERAFQGPWESLEEPDIRPVSPGKRSLTMELPARESASSMLLGAPARIPLGGPAESGPAPFRDWMDVACRPDLHAVSESVMPGDTADYHGFLGAGREVVALDAGIRARAEQSLGLDLGGVRVHQGERSEAINHDFGARAFTYGQDVVLGKGVSNSINPVMAHELAHVAQQRGARPGIATKRERSARGSAHEIDADRAASRIMTGMPATIMQVGAEQVMCFEGAEHMEIGNHAWGGQMVTVGKVTLPAGVFTALQGDFYGTWEELEKACHEKPELINEYYKVLTKERDARVLHQQDPANHPEPNSNGPIMVAGAKHGRNPMTFLDLAATNFNHFSEQNVQSDKLFKTAARDNPSYAAEIQAAQDKFGHNIAQWLQMHLQAGKRAFEDGLARKELGGVGVAMAAAAQHYLTDAFAAGHMRVPRLEMYNSYQAIFRDGARAGLTGWLSNVPDEIDIKALLEGAMKPISNAAGQVGDAVKQVGDVAKQGVNQASEAVQEFLPDWSDGIVETASDAVNSGIDLVGKGVDALGQLKPEIPDISISLLGVKEKIAEKLNPCADGIGDLLGEKIAGFTTMVLHDTDNKNGVKVHNEAGQSWTATGDHALAASETNEAVAKNCTAAAAQHIKDLHAAGKSGAGQGGGTEPTMPFISLEPITSLVPQVDAETMNEGTKPGGPRDWHWHTMNDEFKAQIKDKAIDSSVDLVSSALDSVQNEVRTAVEAGIRKVLAKLGRVADAVVAKLNAIVDAVMSFMPAIDPTALIKQILQ